MPSLTRLHDHLKLLQVQVVFRHGARTPLHHIASSTVTEALWKPHLAAKIPPSPYPFEIVEICSGDVMAMPTACDNSSRLPGGLYTGELVRSGMDDAFSLGKRLKKQYVDEQNFLSRTFVPAEIYARSTYFPRTIQSLVFAFAGLFGESFHENGKSETLSVLAEQTQREFLYVNPSGDTYCEGLKECKTSKRHLAMKEKLKRVLCVDKLFDDLISTQCRDDCHIYIVRDDFVAREHSGFPLPPGLVELLPDMDRLSTEEMQWMLFGKQSNWGTNIPRMLSPLLKMIMCNIKNHASLPKFHLYSCHDSTIIGLLLALQCSTGLWPPFSADLIFELYQWQKNVRSSSKAQTDCPCPPLDSHGGEVAPAEGIVNEPDMSTDWPQLWFRLLYLGEPVNLGCLWNLPAVKGADYAEGFVPLSSLTDLWSDRLQDEQK